ncbi:MAG: replication initiator protein A [Chloroflexota bacterium]
MVCETPNNNDDQLLPDRHPQHDLFICDVADAVLKDIIPQMEHPFYSLSKKPETNIRRYEHNGNWLEVVPSVKGLATIYDKDILIYAISQVIARLREDKPVGKRVRLNAHELLKFTNRGTAGKDYQALCEALDRLDGTRIRTNIHRGDEEKWEAFGLIEAATVARKFGLDGRLLYCEVVLSDWVFDAIREREVLTLHRDYFRLRKPIERRTYELARKHCGQQERWSVSLEVMHKKSGSKASLKEFRRSIKHLAAHDHLPDYTVIFYEQADQVEFRNRNTMPLCIEEDKQTGPFCPPLKPDTYHKARLAAPGRDIYNLEEEWREWMTEPPRNPDAAFIGFCRKVHEKRRHQ